MPILNIQAFVQTNDPNGKPVLLPPQTGLHLAGPCVQVTVGLAKPFAEALIQSGKTVPPPISGNALIDTGATATCIDDAVAQQLGLSPIDVAMLSTASQAQSQHNVYPASIEVLGSNIQIDAPRAIGAPLACKGLIALIGRDVLMRCVLIYNGPSGQFTLAVP